MAYDFSVFWVDLEKIKLESSAGTGHFYTTDKNKNTTPEKLELTKIDPKARKHVITKNEAEVGKPVLSPHPPQGWRALRSNRIVNTVPLSGEDSTAIVPSWPSTISRAMKRPSPRLVFER